MMKAKTKYKVFFLLIAAALTVFGACSGVIGGTTVRLVLPDLPDGGIGRYIAGGGDTPDEVHIIVAKQNKAYSYNNFEGTVTPASNNTFYITNLQADDYVIGVALLNSSDEMVNLKLQEVSFDPGFNDIVMELGPGIDILELNGEIIDNPFMPEGYTVSFGTDTMIFDVDTSVPNTLSYIPSFVPPLVSGEIIIGGVPSGAPNTPGPWTVNPGEDGVYITITGLPLPTPTMYFTLLLE